MRILILEDDLLTAMDLQLLVEEGGHDVVGPCGSLAAARLAVREGFDFAFLDVDLPDGKSFEIAKLLEASGVPFCFVSGSTRHELPESLRGADFIAKPYQHAAIRRSLRELSVMAA